MVVHGLPWHNNIGLYNENEIGADSAPSPMETTPESISSKLLTTADASATQNHALLELASSMLSHQEWRFQCMMLRLQDHNNLSKNEADNLSRLKELIADHHKDTGVNHRLSQRESYMVNTLNDGLVRLDKVCFIRCNFRAVYQLPSTASGGLRRHY